MTGVELKDARTAVGSAIGRELSPADMARLLGLSFPQGSGKNAVLKWEEGEEPPGPVAILVKLLLDGITPDPNPGRIDAIIGGWFNSYIWDLLEPWRQQA